MLECNPLWVSTMTKTGGRSKPSSMTSDPRACHEAHYSTLSLGAGDMYRKPVCLEPALARQVWVVDLVLYGALPADLNVGEAWVSPASWLQLLGFSLLLAGTIIYAQVLAFDYTAWLTQRGVSKSVPAPWHA
jgi:hypothetical protein